MKLLPSIILLTLLALSLLAAASTRLSARGAWCCLIVAAGAGATAFWISRN